MSKDKAPTTSFDTARAQQEDQRLQESMANTIGLDAEPTYAAADLRELPTKEQTIGRLIERMANSIMVEHDHAVKQCVARREDNALLGPAFDTAEAIYEEGKRRGIYG